jgi:hypothetical protein
VARPTQKDLLGRLQELSEDAIQKLSDAPGADKMLGAFSSMRELMDDMQKRLRGLEGLDQRIAGIERRLEKLEKGGSSASSSPARSTTTTKSSGASKTSSASSAAKKP